MMSGTVFNIQHFCLNDGPGIRTTVFLKGCPLHCAWCHNPESHSVDSEILYDPALCIGCGDCITACPNRAKRVEGYDKTACIACGRCAEACPSNALECAGKSMSVEDVMQEVLRDAPFYTSSHGGLTLSGGEPLLQKEFSYDLLRRAKKAGLHTCVETCGYGAANALREIAEETDLFLYDWKLTQSDLHKHYTGVGSQQIKENLLMLDAMGKPVILRCPVIPDVNDTQQHFVGIADLANACSSILHVELEPYHALGTEKSKRMGEAGNSFHIPTEEEILQWQTKLSALTNKEIKIG